MYADSDVIVDENGRRRRRRRIEGAETREGGVQSDNSFEEQLAKAAEARARRECPVPKPGGLLGEWLGFHQSKDDSREAAPRRVDR
jgi:cytochrome c oxidase assembly factor 2